MLCFVFVFLPNLGSSDGWRGLRFPYCSMGGWAVAAVAIVLIVAGVSAVAVAVAAATASLITELQRSATAGGCPNGGCCRCYHHIRWPTAPCLLLPSIDQPIWWRLLAGSVH